MVEPLRRLFPLVTQTAADGEGDAESLTEDDFMIDGALDEAGALLLTIELDCAITELGAGGDGELDGGLTLEMKDDGTGIDEDFAIDDDSRIEELWVTLLLIGAAEDCAIGDDS